MFTTDSGAKSLVKKSRQIKYTIFAALVAAIRCIPSRRFIPFARIIFLSLKLIIYHYNLTGGILQLYTAGY